MLHVTKSISRNRAIRSIPESILKRYKSSSPLEGDAGSLATHTYHKLNTALVFLTPIYFAVPVPDMAGKAFGLLMAGSISFHSWVGMNYVVTDYVPKIGKRFLGHGRIFCAGLSAITLIGLGKVALNDHGGIKGAVMGLWSTKSKKEDETKDTKTKA